MNTNINIKLKSAVMNTTAVSGGRGQSAYEVWLSEGNVGSALDFLQSLKAGTYVFSPPVAASKWIINHNLGYIPYVIIVDENNARVISDVKHKY